MDDEEEIFKLCGADGRDAWLARLASTRCQDERALQPLVPDSERAASLPHEQGMDGAGEKVLPDRYFGHMESEANLQFCSDRGSVIGVEQNRPGRRTEVGGEIEEKEMSAARSARLKHAGSGKYHEALKAIDFYGNHGRSETGLASFFEMSPRKKVSWKCQP
jgi:hypothetical protein